MRKATTLPSIIIILLLIAIVMLEYGIKFLAKEPLLPDLGTGLATLGLGLVLPFVVFESLLVGKVFGIHSNFTTYSNTMEVRYVLEPRIAAMEIPRLRFATSLVVFGCFILWVLTLISALIATTETYYLYYVAFGTGILNCLIAWAYLVFV